MSGAGGAVRLPRDAAYLREHYLQWLVFRSRQRWPMLIALLLALAGVASLLAWPAQRPLLAGPVAVLVLLALLLWGLPLAEFRRWKRQALAGRPALPDLVLELRDGDLWFGAGDGPDALRLPIRGRSVRACHGWLLYADGRDGRHLYLPDRWAARADVRGLLVAAGIGS